MAQCEVQIEDLKAKRASVSKCIRDLEGERNKLGHTLDTGKREQDIECWWRRSDVLREWQLQRPDTGETVEVRPFGPLDFTRELPFDDAPDGDQAGYVVTADGEVLTAVNSDFVIGTAPAPAPEAAAPVVQLLAQPPRRPAPKARERKRGKAKATAAT